MAALGKAYPASSPVLVLRERQLRAFDYMLLLPGSDGHDEAIELTRACRRTVERVRPQKFRPKTAPSSPQHCHAGPRNYSVGPRNHTCFVPPPTTVDQYVRHPSLSPWLLISPAHPCYRLSITHLHNLPPAANAPSGPPVRCAFLLQVRPIRSQLWLDSGHPAASSVTSLSYEKGKMVHFGALLAISSLQGGPHV